MREEPSEPLEVMVSSMNVAATFADSLIDAVQSRQPAKNAKYRIPENMPPNAKDPEPDTTQQLRERLRLMRGDGSKIIGQLIEVEDLRKKERRLRRQLKKATEAKKAIKRAPKRTLACICGHEYRIDNLRRHVCRCLLFDGPKVDFKCIYSEPVIKERMAIVHEHNKQFEEQQDQVSSMTFGA